MSDVPIMLHDGEIHASVLASLFWLIALISPRSSLPLAAFIALVMHTTAVSMKATAHLWRMFGAIEPGDRPPISNCFRGVLLLFSPRGGFGGHFRNCSMFNVRLACVLHVVLCAAALMGVFFSLEYCTQRHACAAAENRLKRMMFATQRGSHMVCPEVMRPFPVAERSVRKRGWQPGSLVFCLFDSRVGNVVWRCSQPVLFGVQCAWCCVRHLQVSVFRFFVFPATRKPRVDDVGQAFFAVRSRNQVRHLPSRLPYLVSITCNRTLFFECGSNNVSQPFVGRLYAAGRRTPFHVQRRMTQLAIGQMTNSRSLF